MSERGCGFGEAPPVWRVPGMRELAAVSFVGFLGYAVLLPVAPLWAVHGGADTAGAGLVNGVLLASTVLTQMLVPRALRRFGWPVVLPIGMALLGIPALLYAASDVFGVVLVLSAVRGAGFGVLTVTGSSAVARLVGPRRRGEAIGLYGLAIALPNLLLLPLGPWVAEHVGFWVVFVVSGLPLLGTVAARRLAQVIDERAALTDDVPDVEHRTEPPLAAYRRLLRPMLLLMSVTLAGGALITFMPLMVSSGWLTALALFVMGLAAALARWGAGVIADRHGAQRFLWPLLLLATAGTALTAWSVVHPGATRTWALLVGVAVVGISYGALQNLTLVVSFSVVRGSHSDLASATWNIGFDTGTAIGSIAVGAIAVATSFTVALVIAAAVTIGALPLATRRPGVSRRRP